METILTQKKCTKCGLIKLISEFENDKRKKSGKGSRCKKCGYEYTILWRKEHPDRAKEQGRENYLRHREQCIARAIKYGKEHPEYRNEFIDKWHRAHPEKQREANRKSLAKYPEKALEKTRKYRRENPEKCATWVENRRSRKINAKGTITSQEWKNLKIKYDNTCLCCLRKDVRLTLDHVIPLSKGGDNTIENSQPLCGSCNSTKSDKTIDYRPEIS